MEIEGLVLAAGLSTRAKTYKMTLDVDGKCIIEKCIESMYDLCSNIVVVGGHKSEKIEAVLSKYSKIKVIYNENYKEGMFSSVKKGIKEMKKDKFFFTPGDYPLIQKETYKSLLRFENDIVIPRYNGRKGHPILIKTSSCKELIQSNKYGNLREWVRSTSSKILDVNDAGILKDVDTMEDYYDILDAKRISLAK